MNPRLVAALLVAIAVLNLRAALRRRPAGECWCCSGWSDGVT